MFNVNVKYTIQKSSEDIFDAICKPEKLTQFFATRSSGNIEENKTITWFFDDYECGVQTDINVTSVKENELIIFNWSASGKSREVIIKLTSISTDKTEIEVSENGFSTDDENDIKNALGQQKGWTDFVCSLKVFLHTELNLRKL